MRRTIFVLLTLVGILLVTLPLRAEEPEAPPPAADQARIQTLVEDLGSADFEVRERAQRELLALGEAARPALERTMRESENMEARWRAEQILRRLDREGERPMGQRPGEEPGNAPEGESPLRRLDDLERRMAEILKRFGQPFPGLGAGPGGFGSAFGDFGTQGFTLAAPGLRLEGEVFAGRLTHVLLFDEVAGRVRMGRGLEDILAREPALAEHDGMPELQERWKEFKEKNPGLFSRTPGPSFRFSQSSQGVEVIHDGEGVTVRIRDTDENGEPTVREYRGKSLEELKEKHPELKERLGRFQVSIDLGPPQIFRRGPGGPRLPVPPAPEEQATPSEDTSRAEFGVRVQELEPVLAIHLGLEQGRGALVVQVVPGSQAEVFGLERFDILLTTEDGAPMRYDDVVAALRRAGREGGRLRLEIIRRGERLVLTR